MPVPRGLIQSFVLKYLEIRPMLAAKEPQPAHNCARVNVEMPLHPIIGSLKGSKFKHVLAANYIHKKICRLRQVRNREADVFSSSSLKCPLAGTSPMKWTLGPP